MQAKAIFRVDDTEIEAPPAPMRTLLARVVLVAVTMIVLMGVVLFAAIDHFVRLQFAALQQQRVAQQGQELAAYLDNETQQFARLVEFVAADSDLIHATQYHLFLRGEDKALRADVQRVARTFELEFVAIRDKGDEVVLSVARDTARSMNFDRVSFPAEADADVASQAVAVWDGAGVWLVATAPLGLPGRHAVTVRIARRLSGLLVGIVGGGDSLPPRVIATGSASSGVAVPMYDLAGQRIVLEMAAQDDVGQAIDAVMQILGVLVVVTAAALGLALTWFLRRELAPVHALTRAAAAVGRGDFKHSVQVKGESEVARLARVFNRMVQDLQRLYKVEQSVRHKEQLAAIGRLATRVAHDINNPLTVIKNSSRLAARVEHLPDALREDLALIAHNCDRCIGIVEALLRFGRPVQLRRTRLDLAQLCADTSARFSRQHPQARLQLDLTAEPLMLHGDPYQLEQLIENLLANAFQAAPGGEIDVTCSALPRRARMQVRDRGPGFSADALRHFAEPFYTTKANGTGLGLASCQIIARAHGGTLTVLNDAGAVLTVDLPLGPDAGGGPGTEHASDR